MDHCCTGGAPTALLQSHLIVNFLKIFSYSSILRKAISVTRCCHFTTLALLPERKMLPCGLLAYADAMMTNPTPRLPFHCFFRKFSFSSILRRCCNHHEKLPALHLTTQNAPLQRPLVPQHDAIQMDANPANATTDRGPRTKFSSFISVGATKKPRHNVQHRNTNNKAVAVRQEAQCHGTTCNTAANTVAQCHRQHCRMKCNAAANAATARYKCWPTPRQCEKK